MSQLELDLDVVFKKSRKKKPVEQAKPAPRFFEYRSVGGIKWKNLNIHQKINFHSHNEGSYDISCLAHKDFIYERHQENEVFEYPVRPEKREKKNTIKEKKLTAKQRKEAEALMVEVGLKMIREDFLKQWKRLTINRKINIKCHQPMHIYRLYPNLLRNDVKQGCSMFEDLSRFGEGARTRPCCSWWNKMYNNDIK